MPKWVTGTHADSPTGGFGGAAYGATKRCTGFQGHPDGPTGGFSGAPNGATKRCTGWVTMPNSRAVPLEGSVELPVGPRNAVLGG
eukprot:4769244-Pyramimonas_sp.AAC.1